ncbi:unnamed protein product (mitochondrion) [Plasmodiophora brassicae]|nr:unnamed protein product [Plasmodiophora brassicae]
MAIVDRIRVGRAVSNMSALALVVLLSGHTGAIVLRSYTGAQHDFDDATFDAQSEKASNIRSNGNEPLPITKPVLDAIADYIKVIKLKGVESGDVHAREIFNAYGLSDWPNIPSWQCHLFDAGMRLGMPRLLIAFMSTKESWAEIFEMIPYLNGLGEDAFSYAVAYCPGIVRLREAAGSEQERQVVDAIHKALVTRGPQARFISSVEWQGHANVAHWAASMGEDAVVDLLIYITGEHTLTADTTGRTPIRKAMDQGHVAIVRMLQWNLAIPDQERQSALRWLESHR